LEIGVNIVLAGGGTAGTDGVGTSAGIGHPAGIALDGAGKAYIVDA